MPNGLVSAFELLPIGLRKQGLYKEYLEVRKDDAKVRNTEVKGSWNSTGLACPGHRVLWVQEVGIGEP